MIVVFGLLIVIVAAGLGVAGVATNSGSAHLVGSNFDLLGLHLTGLSTGQLFLYGIVVGAVAMLGLSMLLGAFTRRLASLGSRRELKRSRRETAALRSDRDRVTQQLDDEHTERLLSNAGSNVGGTVLTPPGPSSTSHNQTTRQTPVPVDHSRVWDRFRHHTDQ
jgi:hypothetical protein